MTFDSNLSLAIKKRVRARDKECFRNATMGVLTYWKKGSRSVRYVEGYAKSAFGMILHHGWIEYRDKIIDPTPTWLADTEKGLTKYYPVRRYTRSQIFKHAIVKHGMLPVTETDYAEPDYKAAYLRATLDQLGEDGFNFLYGENAAAFRATAMKYDPSNR